MPKFSANISTLFPEVPMKERIGLASEAGFEAVEIQFPYDEDPRSLRDELDRFELELVLMNFPAGDLLSGGQGLAAIPGREGEFEEQLAKVKRYIELLEPKAMNLLAGRPDVSHDFNNCYSVFCHNLRRAFELTDLFGITLLTEPANTKDLPNFFLSDSNMAIELIDTLNDIELFIQYDLYHMAIMEGDIENQLPDIVQYIRHFQFSDLPNRTEPGLGTLDFERLFSLIDSIGYSGYVGAEYFPTIATSETFDWFLPYKKQEND